MLAERPDLEIKWIRGNIEYSFRKTWKTKIMTQLFLAAAGSARSVGKQTS